MVLDVAQTLVITAYFVIATGSSDRQVRSIADEIEDALRVKGSVKPIGREGEREAKWVLLDFGDVVVHVFQPEEREFYRLEKLWSGAPRLDVPGTPTSVTSEPDSGLDLESEPASGDAAL